MGAGSPTTNFPTRFYRIWVFIDRGDSPMRQIPTLITDCSADA